MIHDNIHDAAVCKTLPDWTLVRDQSQAGDAANSLSHHHLDEFLVVDLAITIYVSFANHFIDFFVGKLLTEIGHDMAQLCCTDEAITVAIKHLECLDELLFCVYVFHLPGHQTEELREVNGAITIGVHFVDHILKLGFSWVLAQGAHDCAKLLGGDSAVAVFVEKRKGFLELGDLLLGQLVSHVCASVEMDRSARGKSRKAKSLEP